MAHDHEQIEYGISELTELMNSCVLTGTVIEVDTDNDKADVEVSGHGRINDIPIFYHCGGSDVVEGGSAAFEEDDSVYILNREGRVSPNATDLKIVGFVDGLKACCFSDPFTEEDFTWVEQKNAIADGLLEHITSLSGVLNFSAIFDKPSGAPYPAIFRGGNSGWYRISDLDLPSCKYLVFKLTAVNVVEDPIGWSGGCNGTIAISLSPSGESMVLVYEGAAPGLYYKENIYPDRKISAVMISGGYYCECYDISTLHHEVNMTFDYIKMSNEIPEGGTQVWSQIPL